jgi:hypothetical protein
VLQWYKPGAKSATEDINTHSYIEGCYARVGIGSKRVFLSIAGDEAWSICCREEGV